MKDESTCWSARDLISSRELFLILGAFIVFPTFVGCSDSSKFFFAKMRSPGGNGQASDKVSASSGSTDSGDEVQQILQKIPESERLFGQICGGGRVEGKAGFPELHGCDAFATSDESCDRWGCAIQIDSNGTSSCPEGTRMVKTSSSPTYFVCVGSQDRALPGMIVGGARSQGKSLNIGGNACALPATPDQSCDRWGQAVMANEQGDSNCPEGAIRVPTAGSPRYFVCLGRPGAGRITYVCGGARGMGAYTSGSQTECSLREYDDGSCNRWGCATADSAGNGYCPAGTTPVRTSDNYTYLLCLKDLDLN